LLKKDKARSMCITTIFFVVMIVFWITLLSFDSLASAKPPKSPKAKFYDFSEQLIDGQIRRPAHLYTDGRAKVKFERLLKLKKSFLPDLFKTSRESVFK